MPLRFLIPTPHPVETGGELPLSREQSHYIARVMRKQPGDALQCFDGQGRAFSATLTATDSRGGVISIVDVQPRASRPPGELHLALSLLKGAAMDRAIQQAVELGASEISLLTTAHTEVRLRDARRSENKLSHWRKTVEAACEQCGALYVPVVHPPVSLQEKLASCGDTAIVFDMSGAPLPDEMPAEPQTLFIGPEGGWDERELAGFHDAGVPIYRLEGNVLRAETMPAVVLALMHRAQARKN